MDYKRVSNVGIMPSGTVISGTITNTTASLIQQILFRLPEDYAANKTALDELSYAINKANIEHHFALHGRKRG